MSDRQKGERWPLCRCSHKRANHAGGRSDGTYERNLRATPGECRSPDCACSAYRPKPAVAPEVDRG